MASFVAARKAVSAVIRRSRNTTTARTFASAAAGNGAAELNAGTG